MNEVIYPPCRKCGATHGMGIETMATGEITPIDICYKCLWKPWKPKFFTEQVVLNEETTCPSNGDFNMV